jgi:TetR/AcrR family transcriptional regulator, transcriptional repressor for nem operon
MPRVSRKEADRHREEIVKAAARLFLERGIDGVSVPMVMAEAGLTHGGFYGHFESKEALVAEACQRAFESRFGYYEAIERRNETDAKSARSEFISKYLSKAHRDSSGLGCPAAALCGEIALEEPKGETRKVFADGLSTMVDRLSNLLSGKKKSNARQEALSQIATLVGALMLARATKGSPVSEEILSAARASLLE